jgi:hydrogenase maturation protease
LGTPALDLIDAISRKDAVILIDSIRVEMVLPGTVLRYNKTEIMRECPAARMDPHSPALVETLHNVEIFATAPEDVLLIGIVGETYEPACNLSPRVAATCARVVEEVLHELDRLGVRWKGRRSPLDSGIWWTPVDQITMGAA